MTDNKIMNDRDRLLKLFNKFDLMNVDTEHFTEHLVDYLIANGVILPPCKSEQTVYELTTSEEIKRRKVKDIIYDNGGFRLRLEPYFSYEYYLNETVFLTKEEAEKALERSKGNA